MRQQDMQHVLQLTVRVAHHHEPRWRHDCRDGQHGAALPDQLDGVDQDAEYVLRVKQRAVGREQVLEVRLVEREEATSSQVSRASVRHRRPPVVEGRPSASTRTQPDETSRLCHVLVDLIRRTEPRVRVLHPDIPVVLDKLSEVALSIRAAAHIVVEGIRAGLHALYHPLRYQCRRMVPLLVGFLSGLW